MNYALTALVLSAAASAPLYAQSFEVASIKPMPSDSRPTRPVFDPSHVSLQTTLQGLIVRAYHLSYDQVSGPDWIDARLYAVAAKEPEGASAEQIDRMMQNLLSQRFQLTFHRQTRVDPGLQPCHWEERTETEAFRSRREWQTA